MKTSNATTDQRVIRPGGVDAKEGGAAGGTCSSPGGRSGVSVGLQKENSTAKVSETDPQANWNNLRGFEIHIEKLHAQTLPGVRAHLTKKLGAMEPTIVD